MPSSGRLTFDLGDKPVIIQTEAKTPNSKNGWTFLGTYEKLVWTTESCDYGFSALNPNDDIQREFTRFGDGDYILPLRCYLRYLGEYAFAPAHRIGAAPLVLPDSIEVRLVDFPSDAVTALQAKDEADKVWFTLDGRKLEKRPAQQGVYINNGKKIRL